MFVHSSQYSYYYSDDVSTERNRNFVRMSNAHDIVPSPKKKHLPTISTSSMNANDVADLQLLCCVCLGAWLSFFWVCCVWPRVLFWLWHACINQRDNSHVQVQVDTQNNANYMLIHVLFWFSTTAQHAEHANRLRRITRIVIYCKRELRARNCGDMWFRIWRWISGLGEWGNVWEISCYKSVWDDFVWNISSKNTTLLLVKNNKRIMIDFMSKQDDWST